jgi:hypothetical protein
MSSLRDDILQEHSKAQTMRIVHRIGDDRAAFDELMQLFFHDEYRVVQRAAWPIGYCLEAHPEWTVDYLPLLLKNLRNLQKGQAIHDAVKRNTVRALMSIEIPEALAGEAADILFRFTADPREPIAVRCFSIAALFNLCKTEPDLLEELRLTIEDILVNDTTSGLRSRCNRTLSDIAKLSKK